MLSKEKFKFKDRLIKGISEDGNFKISVVKTTDVVKAAKRKHNLSALTTVLLGRALTGCMLMASELKGEERIQVKAEGNGPVGFLIAEANRVGEIRGYVQYPQATIDYSKADAKIGDGLGIGLLTISKTLYNEAKPHKSSIELVKGNITGDLAYYMVQSEQVASAILLDVGLDVDGSITQTGGVLIQRLPDAPDHKIDRLQEKLKSFPGIDELLGDGSYIDEIMRKAMAPISVKELDRQPVDFFCRCTRKRFVNAVAMLGYKDLKEMSREGQDLVCHYCNKQYHISQEEIEKIMLQTKAKMN